MTTHAERTYVPAAGHDWALPLYDPIVTLLGGNRTRKALVDRARLTPAQRVLEIGCGTGSLLLQIKRSHTDVDVVGLDPDPKALARAKRKAERAAVALQLDQASSDDMPYPAASFDRVFSSFMFHHLAPDEREKTLREVRRVLKPEGSLHLLDFAGTDSGSHGSFMRLLHSSHQLQDNSDDRILSLMRQAGFSEVRKVGGGSMLVGQIRLSYYYGGASG